MDEHAERAGLSGVGFLFGFIALFLLVASLRATAHSQAAVVAGLAGSAVLALFTFRFLLRRWRSAATVAAFNEDGDVAFGGAVFLLSTIGLAAGLAIVTGISLSKLAILPLLFAAAAIPARTFVRRLRRPR